MDTFVREVLQNSHDQRLPGASRSEVDFDLLQLSGERKAAFLEALHWETLRDHLSGIAGGSSPTAARIARELRDVEQRPLRLLRIADRGTRGLVGGEDQDGENFQALCRNVLDTSESNLDRGGSHGLGKAVLWAFSGVSVVLFHSIIGEGHDENRHRFFAKAEFPSHDDASSQPWDGPGWFGQPDPDIPARAISMWDEAAESAAAALETARRSPEPGTSILVVDLDEPLSDEDRPLVEIGEDIAASASRWFWPALTKGSLGVRVRVFHDDEVVADNVVGLTSEVRPFAEAMGDPSPTPDARTPGQCAERVVTIGVPASKGVGPSPASPETEADARLRIRSATSEDAERWENHVALIRGAGMVVQYWRSPRHRNGEHTFHAVLSAGLASGSSESDKAADRFLRACEPPAHDKWVAGTKRQRELYEAGAGTRLKRLEDDIQAAIDEALFAIPPTGESGPEALRKLFRIGTGTGGGSRSEHRFATSVRSGSLVGQVWHVLADLHHAKGSGIWTARLELFLDAESGRGSRLDIAEASVEGAATLQVEDGRALLVVDGDQRVTVRLESTGAEPMVSTRTRVRLDARFKPGESFS
ncbi:MAG: hypothetical protein R8F63_00640 [Acidimicrobiales bacterium]|nr:hypothetical protein [Acidimicrobiales bacterium]